MLPKLFFSYFAVAMVVLSVLIITRKNPVHSVLWMLVLFFHIAGLYLLLNAEFLAAVQVILYAGAILVLFLFVVMMLNLREELEGERFIGGWPLGVSLGAAIFVLMSFMMSRFVPGPTGPYTVELIKSETHTRILGKLLYTEYLFPFEVASLILLIAIVGAIVLAKKRS
ncbi:MAG TPA: NADH-quinone oxidoreductase subunit J [Dissulfurispiraceae bacterium]